MQVKYGAAYGHSYNVQITSHYHHSISSDIAFFHLPSLSSIIRLIQYLFNHVLPQS